MHAALTRVRVCEQGADGEKDFGDGQRRAPVVLQDIQADVAGCGDVAVVNAGAEGDLQGGILRVKWGCRRAHTSIVPESDQLLTFGGLKG